MLRSFAVLVSLGLCGCGPDLPPSAKRIHIPVPLPQPNAIDLGPHFRSPAQKSLVELVKGEDSSSYYVPKGAKERYGPVVLAHDFVAKHFGSGRMDVHLLFDPGTDDFVAGLYALARKERFRLQSVTAGFGNVAPEQTLANAKLYVALSRQFELPVYKGAQGALDGKPRPTATGVHGDDGLDGARPFNWADIQRDLGKVMVKEDGPAHIVRDVLERHKKDAEPVLLVSLGAMTDLYRVLELVIQQEPTALRKVRVSIMGGGLALHQWHTNITDWAEFNFFQDPKAASLAFGMLEKHGVPVVVAPLDVTHQTSVSSLYEGHYLETVAARDRNPVADMVAQMFSHASSFDRERSLELYGFAWRRRFVHDPNALCVLVSPKLYRGFAARVKVAPTGDERGRMTATADKDSHVFVLVSVEAEAVVRQWLEVFSTP